MKFPLPEIPVEIAWDHMKSMLDAKMPLKGSFKSHFTLTPGYKYWAIAAVISLLMASMLILFYFSNQHNNSVNEIKLITSTSYKDVIKEKLPDSSVVILNEGSSIQYPERFNSTQREVKLTGEAYFKVKHDPARPFIVNANNINIKVLGTAFNVKSLQAGSITQVNVTQGKVLMFNSNNQIIINAGLEGTYNEKTGIFSLDSLKDENSIAYATRVFNFKDISLKDICSDLEKAYAVTIHLQNNSIAQCHMTSRFDNKPINYILDVISATFDLSYKKTGNEIYISGAGCK